MTLPRYTSRMVGHNQDTSRMGWYNQNTTRTLYLDITNISKKKKGGEFLGHCFIQIFKGMRAHMWPHMHMVDTVLVKLRCCTRNYLILLHLPHEYPIQHFTVQLLKSKAAQAYFHFVMSLSQNCTESSHTHDTGGPAWS